MAKKVDVSEKIYNSYKRNHSGSDFRDTEESKIKREKTEGKILEKKAKKVLDNIVAKGGSDSDAEQYEAISHQIIKKKRGMKTHKERFASLSKNDDF